VTAPLAGRSAVVTGASRGIGLATARVLAGAGARVAMLARRADVLAARAEEVSGGIPIACDVTDEHAVSQAADAIKGLFAGAPDVLVNNAGVFRPVRLEAMSTRNFIETIRSNLLSPFLLLHAFLPAMRERGSGHVVTIGSVADHVPFPENGAYSASKFGVRALHEVMRAELRGSGVRATLVSPGPTDTPIWDGLEPAGAGRFPPRAGMLRPEAVADAILFALTRDAAVNVDELRLSST
jgi:NAD(P)-dependent dehydrogenase (short-subunit alcohol dehydrogenase family)